MFRNSPPRISVTTIQQWLGDFARRIEQLRLFQTAASLASLSLLAIVPLLSLGLWVLSLSPSFGKLKTTFLRLFEQMLLPNVSAVVVRYVDQFSARSADLPIIAFLGFVLTAYAAVNTVDKTFQLIFGVTARRSITHRFLNYTFALCMGPLLLATLYLLTVGFGTPVVEWVLSGVADTRQEQRWVNSQLKLFWPLFIALLMLIALYKFLPSTRVNLWHAVVGALFSLVTILLLKVVLAAYFSAFPTFKTVYGAIAVLPIFLLWLNALWLLVILGALVVAQLSVGSDRLTGVDQKAALSSEQMFNWSQQLATVLYDRSPDPRNRNIDSDWIEVSQLGLFKSNDSGRFFSQLTLLEQGGFIQTGKRPGARFNSLPSPHNSIDALLVRWRADANSPVELRLKEFLWRQPLPILGQPAIERF